MKCENGHFPKALLKQNGLNGLILGCEVPKTYEKLLCNHIKVGLFKIRLKETPNILKMTIFENWQFSNYTPNILNINILKMAILKSGKNDHFAKVIV